MLLHRWFDTWRRIGDVVEDGSPGLRPRAPALRRPRVAGNVLSERLRALIYVACGQRVGAHL